MTTISKPLIDSVKKVVLIVCTWIGIAILLDLSNIFSPESATKIGSIIKDSVSKFPISILVLVIASFIIVSAVIAFWPTKDLAKKKKYRSNGIWLMTHFIDELSSIAANVGAVLTFLSLPGLKTTVLGVCILLASFLLAWIAKALDE